MRVKSNSKGVKSKKKQECLKYHKVNKQSLSLFLFFVKKELSPFILFFCYNKFEIVIYIFILLLVIL